MPTPPRNYAKRVTNEFYYCNHCGKRRSDAGVDGDWRCLICGRSIGIYGGTVNSQKAFARKRAKEIRIGDLFVFSNYSDSEPNRVDEIRYGKDVTELMLKKHGRTTVSPDQFVTLREGGRWPDGVNLETVADDD
ncbi:hypothetical protein SAMN04515659_2025 [Dyella sp. 333MFSha]|nr:hypothetical protein SAMN04515659_2025 [Dyella sp. 333MFSha]